DRRLGGRGLGDRLGRPLGRPGRRLAHHAAHQVAHAHHQDTPTMSLMTSAMIFSPISLARLVKPTSSATSHRLLISRGVPCVKSKMSCTASGVKIGAVRPAIFKRWAM